MVAYHRHEYIYPNFSQTIFKSPDFSHVFPLVATLLPDMPLTVGEQSKQSQQRLTAAAVALPQDAPEELVADVAALQWWERVTAEVMLVSSTWTAPYWCLSLRLLLLLSWCSWWPRRSFTLQWWLNTVHNIIMHTLHTHTYFYSTKIVKQIRGTGIGWLDDIRKLKEIISHLQCCIKTVTFISSIYIPRSF